MTLFKTNYDNEKKIWYGNKCTPFYHPDCSIGQAVLRILSTDPDKIVQLSDKDGLKINAQEMKLLSICAAKGLQLLGLQQEDIVGIVASNTSYLAPLVFGAFLNDGIKHMFGITSPKVVFCDDNTCDVVIAALKEIDLVCPIIIINGIVEGFQSIHELFKETGDEEFFIPPKLNKGGKQTAAILCSSGTTGLPKGICITHEAFLTSNTLIFGGDVVLCFSSLYWLSGYTVLICGTLNGGTRLITNQPFSAELMLRLIEQYKVNVLLGPPSQMALTIDCPDIEFRDLSSVKIYSCGGSNVPSEVVKKMQSYLKNGHIVAGYGISEVASAATMQSKHNIKEGSVGEVRINIEIKIVNEDNIQLGVGELGEVCLKTGLVGIEYYKNPEATKEAFDNEGWIHSGDIGYFDEDGHLFIVDRKKEILKYKNFPYFPTEIENVIIRIQDVVEVCVCGLPDIVATDLPAAGIVKKRGSNLSQKEVYDFVANQMAEFKHLRGGVYFLDSLPKTPSGKVLRRTVKEILIKLKEELRNQNLINT